jgi:hypothetical protein
MSTPNRLVPNAVIHNVTGVGSPTLHLWAQKGVTAAAIVPGSGDGSGNHRRYSVMGAVGVVVGARLYNGPRSCVLSYVQRIVEAFAAMSEAGLLEEFARGNTHLVMIHQDRPLLRQKEYDWIDVQSAYGDLQAEMAKWSQPSDRSGRATRKTATVTTAD